MPELPEVETVCTTLDPLIRGRTIGAVGISWDRTIGYPEPERFVQEAVGRTIVGIERRAKLIVIRLDLSNVITVHLRMTGELRFHPAPPEESLSQHLRMKLDLTDKSLLEFIDPRKFGRVELLTDVEFNDVSNRFGVEPLSSEFTPPTLAKLLSSRQRQMKPLLLDQSVVAGLGNIYVDEALFRAGIHPLEISSNVPVEHSHLLHAHIVAVLTEAIANQGTTLRNYRSGLGESGSNQRALRVYGRGAGAPCLTCNTPLVRIVVGQRGTMYCPQCQPRISAPRELDR